MGAEFEITTAELRRAVTDAGAFIELRNVMPSLSAVRLVAARGEVEARLTGHNLDAAVSRQVLLASPPAADVSVLVPYGALRAAAHQPGVEAWRFKAGRDVAGGAQLALSGSAADMFGTPLSMDLALPYALADWPTLPPSASDATTPILRFSAPGTAVAAWLRALLSAASTEDTRYYLNGVQVEPGDGHLLGVATDGHRLLSVPLVVDGLDSASPDAAAIWPREFVRGVLPLLAAESGAVWVTQCRQSIEIVAGNARWRAWGRAVDGRFPDWRRFLPQGPVPVTITVQARDALRRINWVRALARGFGTRDRGAAFTLGYADDRPVLVARFNQSGGQGSAAAQLPVTLDPPDIDAAKAVWEWVGFNTNYLAEMLTALAQCRPDEPVRLLIRDDRNPTEIRAGNALGVLMLMRL